MNKREKIASIQEEDEDSKKRAREEERALVAQAKAGDTAAFKILFQRYHRRAYSVAYSMVHNQDDALDIVQEGFIKAHRYLPKFEGNSSFYTWFYRIVMNLSIDHLRKHKRQRHVELNDVASNLEHESADDALLPHILGHHPGKALIRREIREKIAEALDTLSESHRSVLIMRELEGCSYQEMADVLNCSKGTIMSRLFHARKNMQKQLIHLVGDPDVVRDQEDGDGE